MAGTGDRTTDRDVGRSGSGLSPAVVPGARCRLHKAPGGGYWPRDPLPKEFVSVTRYLFDTNTLSAPITSGVASNGAPPGPAAFTAQRLTWTGRACALRSARLP